MLSFSITDNLGGVIGHVTDWAYALFDLRPLSSRIAAILDSQNKSMRSLGHDRYDAPFVELAESTMKRRVRQGRMGPPLAPDDAASPINAGFVVEQEVYHPDDILIRGWWPGVPWVKYHMPPQGSHLPVRDPVGMPPYAWDQVAVEFDDFVASLLAQTY